MANFSYKLTNLQVDGWFPPTEPLHEQIIQNGTGTYTISVFGTSIGYYLEVDAGTRVNPLRLGQAVRARGLDPEGKPIITEVLETTSTGNPAQFKGPYHAALGATAPAPHAASTAAAGSIVRPSTSTDIVYRAFGRPYDGSGQVISLFASCSYPVGGWQIFFQGGGGGFTLMERVPQAVNELLTYYTASYTEGFGLPTAVKTVSIRDARGVHTVNVEPIA
ncbi:MAG TPA: hypothetical protein VFP84_11610 [Kofleriaceae bacterium]|nr:hypothetical protein [Kofleriaceae bacterium]